MCKRILIVLAIVALIIGGAAGSWAKGDPPVSWQTILAENVSLSTFPTTYEVKPGLSSLLSYQIKYTYGGTGTVAITLECTIDGTNYVTIDTPKAANSVSQDFVTFIMLQDPAATQVSNEVLCFQYRLRFVSAGGSPSLTALYVSYFRRSGT